MRRYPLSYQTLKCVQVGQNGAVVETDNLKRPIGGNGFFQAKFRGEKYFPKRKKPPPNSIKLGEGGFA